MNFIDISNWQNGIDLALMFKENPLDGVIIKATENTGYINPNFKTWAEWLEDNGKLWGAYHFCAGADAKAEAKWFYATIKHYIGKCVPFADYEGDVLHKGTVWLKEFLDEFHRLSGVRPLIYCSQSVTQSQNFTEIAKAGSGLWMAQYADFSPVYGFLEKPWHSGSVAPFNGYHIQQYTSCGVLKGWRSYLDLDKFYGTAEDWKALCGSGEGVEIPPSVNLKGPDPVVVSEVLANKYGVGAEREERLVNAGYDPDKVQKKINTLYTIAEKCAAFCAGNKTYLNSIVKIIRTMLKE
mgnify:CR=1 FL=1